jgi:exopolysaccharide biosynthesis protein PssK
VTSDKQARPNNELVLELRVEIGRVLRSVVVAGSRCALVGFPNHENPGDSAIWLAVRAVLRDLEVSTVFACDHQSYSPEALAAALGDGTILLNGGGNLGDVWPREQILRERIFQDFRRTPIVQLPQSLHFDDPENLVRFRQLVEGRDDVVFLLREEQSLARARQLGVEALLCPDAAFLLEAPMPRDPETTVVCVMRSDREGRGLPAPEGDGIEIVDWLAVPADDQPLVAIAQADQLGEAMTAGADEAELAMLAASILDVYDDLARRRLDRAFTSLQRGRAVITDRLHGHILALLLGIPHVVMDNRYGKLRSVYETWTSGSELVRWAETPEQALQLARAQSVGTMPRSA